MKKGIALVLCALASALPLAAQAQTVTKVGVVDFSKLLLTAYKDTKAYRDYDQALQEYNKEVAARSKELLDLQSQRLDADKAGNAAKTAALDKQIADKQAYLDTYRRVKGATLQQQSSSLNSGPMLQEIYDIIRLVSEKGGYSIILRRDVYKELYILVLPEVDITQDVIDEIAKRKSGG